MERRPMVTRRAFMRRAAAFGAGFTGLHALAGRTGGNIASLGTRPGGGYGPLVPDPAGTLDLPTGFSYTEFSRLGQEMADGFLLPGRHDGMAAFPGPEGTTILVRNHENEPQQGWSSPFGSQAQRLPRLAMGRIFDAGHGRTPSLGGTTTVVYDTREGRVVREFLSLVGTERNCAGGPTPWGTWLTCEEDTSRAGDLHERDHGWVFEVPASAEPAVAPPAPLIAMGRFRHEAAAVDPRSGCVYQTEDLGDGLIYRFLPLERGRLAAGGRLQALRARGRPRLDTRNWGDPRLATGQPIDVEWFDLDEVRSPADDLRFRGAERGGAIFARGEGMWYGRDAVYWVCTEGGSARCGQLWRYAPSPAEGTPGEADRPARLELFVEPNDGAILRNADNITVAPWGDLIVCEDNLELNRLLGITPRGEVYTLARNVRSQSELAGATFSPDGTTLFVNIQEPGSTLAIRGPWK